jgi:hypothetical protein
VNAADSEAANAEITQVQMEISNLANFEELNILVQEGANYHFRHFYKNEVEVCEQKLAVNMQLQA